MKNMLLTSNDSLFLVNSNLFFKKFGYNVMNASDYIHAINSIKTLADTNEKINILIIKSRNFSKEDKLYLRKIVGLDDDIFVIVLSDQKENIGENVQFIDYYASPIEIIDRLKNN